MARIEIIGVNKAYGKVSVMEGMNLEIANGEFVVLLGPSGCGKSTLLRMVAGLEDVTSGEIRFDGDRVDNIPTQRRNVAMVFQNYALYPHMSVRDNLGYGLKIAGHDKAAIDAKVRQAAETLGLTEYLDRKPKALSGGQRQRVAMGRSIVREPAAFLFDEPLSNLDAKLRGQMRNEIRQLQSQLRTTALYVTHDQVEAMTLADRVVVLNKGRIEQIAEPMELYARPASIFVADFVGTNPMNLLEGEIAADGSVHTLGHAWAVPENVSDLPALAGRKVVLGVRPEHVEVTLDGELPVENVEPLGSDTTFNAVLPGGGKVLVRCNPNLAIRNGDRVSIAAPASVMHLFDAQSGRRLN